MSTTPGCDRCVNHDRAALEAIGEPEAEELFGGKSYEVTTRYRCKACGTLWRHLREGGAGGSGRHWFVDPPTSAQPA